MTTQDVLKQCTVEGLVVKLPGLPLDRKDYLDVKNKLELIGGKWKGGKVSGFVFEQDPTELLADVANGDNRNLKKEFQFFATPMEVIDKMVEHIPDLEPGFKILEPSAGDGVIINYIRSYVEGGENIAVDCFELMDLNRKKLEKVEGAVIQGDDFLTHCVVKNYYDIVIANPPFTKNQDIDHIRKMYEVCKPGGTIVTLASPSWTFGSQKKQVEFRDWLKGLNASITEIDEGAFKDSGTTIRTMMIVINKPIASIEKESPVETPKSFFLREWKGFKLFDAGPYLETGQNKLEIIDIDNKVEHTVYFDRTNPADLNKSIERAKEWINQNFPLRKGPPDSTSSQSTEIKEPLKILKDIQNTNAEITKGTEKLKKLLSPKNSTDMDFFQQLSAMGEVDMTLRIMKKNDKLTLNIMPGSNVSRTQPILITGTPAELDAEFFITIAPEVKEVAGIISNIADVKKAAGESNAAKQNVKHVKKEDKKVDKKHAAKKKAVVKKPEKEKVEPAPTETSLFDQTQA